MAPRKCEPNCTCYKHTQEWKDQCRERALKQLETEPPGYRSERMKAIWANRTQEEKTQITKKAITAARKANQTPEAKEKRKQNIIQAWQAKTEQERKKHLGPALKARGKRFNKPESSIAAALEFMGIQYEKEVCLLDKYFVDFLLDNNVVIEVDGSYWHDETKDMLRDAELTTAGFIVFRIDSKEANEKPVESIAHSLLYGLKRGI